MEMQDHCDCSLMYASRTYVNITNIKAKRQKT